MKEDLEHLRINSFWFSVRIYAMVPLNIGRKLRVHAQQAITFSKLTIEALEQGVKYVQS